MCKILLVFILIVVPYYSHAYRAEGFRQVKTEELLKKANNLGLVLSKNEKAVKKDLVKLKKTNKAEFEKKKAAKLENPSFYQSYILEVDEGLALVEKAKSLAKVVLYEAVESRWDELKLTALNTNVDKDFKKFKIKLVKDLNNTFYLGQNQGYLFEVGQWGYVTVAKNLKAVTWKLQFSAKYDNNKLEPGAEDIQIDESGMAPQDDSDASF